MSKFWYYFDNTVCTIGVLAVVAYAVLTYLADLQSDR